MSDLNKNIVITPNTGNETNPIITFIGKSNIPSYLKVLDDGTVSFEGSAGQILGITNTLDGSLVIIKNKIGVPTLEVLDDGLLKLSEYANNILVGTGIDNNIDKLQINGTITHTGLNPSSGTNIDQLTTITKSLTLISDWQDTGISSTDLTRGSYIIQLYANDFNVGGKNINEYYSGIMSWYDLSPNTTSLLPSDEILLHRSGGSDGDTGIHLRTYRANSDRVKLQIFSNYNNTSSSNYVFSFRRVI